MLTAAQMFLLHTCVALLFFSWMWSSAASTSAVPSMGLPPAAWGCPGWELAPHPALDPGEVTWEETKSPGQHQGWAGGTVLLRIPAQPSVGWDIPDEDFPWVDFMEVVPVEWMMIPGSVMLSWRTAGAVDTASHWAAQTLLHFMEKQDSPEVLTKLTLGAGTRWSSRPPSKPSHSVISCITTMRCFTWVF